MYDTAVVQHVPLYTLIRHTAVQLYVPSTAVQIGTCTIQLYIFSIQRARTPYGRRTLRVLNLERSYVTVPL